MVLDFMQECMQAFLGSFLHLLFSDHTAVLVATACAPFDYCSYPLPCFALRTLCAPRLDSGTATQMSHTEFDR